MFGVAKVHYNYGGGGGSYVGGVCRTERWWWNGTDWQDDPVYTGSFETREQAEKFADECRANVKKRHYFVYGDNDPFGEDPSFYKDE